MKTIVSLPGHCHWLLIFFFFAGIYSRGMAQKRPGDPYTISGMSVYQSKPDNHLFNQGDIASSSAKTRGTVSILNTAIETNSLTKPEISHTEFPVIIKVNGYHGIPSGLKSGKFSVQFKASAFIYPHNPKKEVGLNTFELSRLRLYAQTLKEYAIANHFDTSYAFLANMGILSTRKRFFVINLHSLEVEQSGLVSHGRGPGMSIYDRGYSNDPDSKCTSLGRYKIMSTYKGAFGLSYRIAGLDSSNSNAMKRKIVLHSMHCIPDVESYMPACVSEGCPAVSEQFFSSIRKLIDTRKKPIVLWIIDSNLELPEITEMQDIENPLSPKIKITQTKPVKKVQVRKRAKTHSKQVVQKEPYAGLVTRYSHTASFGSSVRQINDLFGFKK